MPSACTRWAGDKGALDLQQAHFVERDRHRFARAWAMEWRHRLPAAVGQVHAGAALPGRAARRLASRMTELHHQESENDGGSPAPLGQRRLIRVRPQAQVVGRDAPLGRDGRRFRHQQARAGQGQARWIMCQSVALPLSAEYWHMGAMAMRLATCKPQQTA
jgi:hypothetical protein